MAIMLAKLFEHGRETAELGPEGKGIAVGIVHVSHWIRAVDKPSKLGMTDKDTARVHAYGNDARRWFRQVLGGRRCCQA